MGKLAAGHPPDSTVAAGTLGADARATRQKQRPASRAQDANMARRVAEAFGAQLQRVRRERGWKQDAFAKALGVSRTTASNIERGAQRIFLDQVYRAAAVLSVPVDEILPQDQLLTDAVVVHAAADAPLTRSAAKTVARVVEDVLRELTTDNAQMNRSHEPKRVPRRPSGT